MSRFFPLAPEAKDQKYPHLLLALDTQTRAFQGGSLLGASIGGLTYNSQTSPTFTKQILRSTGVGALAGMAIVGMGTAAAGIWSWEASEWKSRSWRRLGDKASVECDDWIYTGMALGVLGTVGRGLGWRGIVGGAGVGSCVGPLVWWGINASSWRTFES